MNSDQSPLNNVKGYATPRAFSGFQIPIPLQSMAIRRYCEERSLRFNLHVVENIGPNSFLVLERVIAESHLYSAVAMCSVGLLPSDTAHRTDILRRAFRSGMHLHFVFEQLIGSTEADIDEINELIHLCNLSSRSRNQTQRLVESLNGV